MEAQRPQVVISGISGRYPQSDNLEELKNNLFAGVDMVTADDSRWPIGLFNLPSRNGKIKSMDKFDNEFFDIPKNKTDLVDPQERILLELTYEAMLDAGVDPKSLKGTKTGVYLGQCFVETHEDFDDPQRAPEMMRQSVTRIANHFEFKGPILLVDTACGSSLSAFNEAFLAIRYGICDQAVVCGSNTLFRPRVSMQFKDLKMVNKDGCCKCLDASANGYVRSEAAISLLLQRSKDSKRIYAKVLNSKSNSDGSKVEGITFPSRVSQAKLCRETYQEAGINVNDIKYVEAHVTGTSAGDPVEMGALFDVICQNRDDPIHVGCIKAAIGHTEGASGLCGISKALIVMQNQLIPPNIHYHSPNLNIEGLVTKKMLPVTRATPLIGDIIPVNCFGFGGANTHVVLQGHFDKSRENKVSGPLPRLIPICGRTVKATKHLGSKLESEPVHWTNEFLSLVNDFSRSASDKFPFRSYCIISEHDSTKAFFKQEPEQVQNSPVWLVLRLEENNGLDMSRLLALDYIKDTMVGLQKPLEQFNINLEQILGENQSKYEDESMVIRYVKTMALQVAYIKLLKWLNFQVSGIVGYSVGLIAKAYHDGQLESDEAILLAYYAALYHDDEIRMKQSFQQVLGSSENGRLSNAQLCDIIESVVRPSQGLNGTPKGVLVIEAGVNGLHEKEKTCTFKPCPLMVTMKTLGQLYMNGNLLAIEKLYPAVKYPLPSTTPSLSSLIQWDHSATWAMKPYLIQNTNTYQTTKKVKFHFDRRTVEDVFLFDHKIDDKVLFPATGYLMMVWSAFSSVTNFAIFEIPIEFRDVVFCRATVMNNQETSFEITISETSGNFEVKESDTVVVKGNIRIDAHSLNKVEPEPVADDVVTLSGKDIYKEFRVRGYDYGQYFQGLSEAKANGREGKITWRDIISESTKDTLNLELEADFANLWLRSWIPFVDAMFQLDILKEENDSRSLFVPTRIESMRINPAKMRQNIEQSPKFLDPLTMNQSSVLNVYGRFDNLTWTDGLLVKGLKTTLLKRRPQQNRLFRYSMIPYSDNNAISDQKKKTIDSYVSTCQDAVNGNVSFDKIAFDLNENCHSLLRSILLSSTDFTDLSQDLLIGAKDDLTNMNSELLYSFVDMVVNNVDLIHGQATTIDLLEVTSSSQLFYKTFVECFPDALVKDLIKQNYTLLHSNPDAIEAEQKEGIADVLKLTDNNMPSLPSQNMIVFRCESAEKAQVMIPKLKELLKDGGFLLVVYNSKMQSGPADDLIKTLNLKVDFFEDSKLQSIGEDCGMVHICDKKLSATSLPVGLMMFRRKNKTICRNNTKFVHIGVQDYETWFEPLKEHLEQTNELNDQRLWLVSKFDAEKSSKFVSGLVGFAKSLRLEENGNQIRCIIDTTVDRVDLFNSKYKKIIEQDLVINIYDDEVGWGNFIPVSIEKQVNKYHDNNYSYLRALKQGDMSSLTWVDSDIGFKVKNSNKKLIDIHYSALNFRDIMFASGKLDSEAIPGIHPNIAQDSILGLEYTGVEKATNARVMGITPYKGLATALQVTKEDEDFIWPVPSNWSLEEAATVPVVYATALYALILRGRLVPGESVLIHSGCGGVGLAAINICMSMGCTVFTTVGSDNKRQYLAEKFPKLVNPVNKIFNSREISFEADLLKVTNGKGVDVILNSLAEDKLQASLNCLAENGRFLEIGKVDFIQNNPLFAHQLSANQSFHGVLLDALFKYGDHTYLPTRLLAEKKKLKQLVLKGIEEGVVKPLDRTVFEKDRVEDAFRYMSTGRHIGKVIVRVRDGQANATRSMKTSYCHPEKSYVVLGGAGGFGLEVVQWLVHKGAKKIVICSRRGIREPYQFYAINRIKNKGVKVVVSQADVTTKDGCRNLLLQADKEGPVGGIFNGAVVYRDSLFKDQTIEQFKEVCGPKAEATLYLDQLSRQLCPELDYFVVFSSLSCGRGNAGQTNYNYANGLMDSVCVDRVANGFPGQSIQWGVVGDVGIVSETSASNDVILLGTMAQRMHSCLDTIDKCLQDGAPIHLSYVNAIEKTGASADENGDILNVVTRLLGLKDISNIEPSTSFGALGLDSLIAVEIKQILEKATGNTMTVKEIRDFTIANLMQLSKNRAAPAASEAANEEVKSS